MPTRLALLVLSALAAQACVTVPLLGRDVRHAQAVLVNQASFDHGCAVEQIRVLRRDAWSTTEDLDVCGVVRRYKVVLAPSGAGTDGVTWLDVTFMYPATSLPQPEPPGEPRPPAEPAKP